MRRFCGKNGLATLKAVDRQLLLDVAYWTLMRQSAKWCLGPSADVDPLYLYSGELRGLDSAAIAAKQAACLSLGLLRVVDGAYVASEAIKLAFCTNLGVHVKPAMGPEFEELCARAAARGCEVSGYRSLVLKLSAPYLQNEKCSYLVKSEAERIVRHLRGTAGQPTRNAVVVLNGPAAKGPDILVLRVCHESKTASCTAVGVKNRKTDTGGVPAKAKRLGIVLTPLSYPNDPVDLAWPECAILFAFSKLCKIALTCSDNSSKATVWDAELSKAELAEYEFAEWTRVLQESVRRNNTQPWPGCTVAYREDLGVWADLFLHDLTPEADRVLRFIDETATDDADASGAE